MTRQELCLRCVEEERQQALEARYLHSNDLEDSRVGIENVLRKRRKLADGVHCAMLLTWRRKIEYTTGCPYALEHLMVDHK
jgi:hypothetical protein